MFRKFMFSVLPLEGHLKMANHGTWATHLEINAAACFLQNNSYSYMYVYTKDRNSYLLLGIV